MYNYYYISLPNISELKQKVLVFSKEEKACELSMMNLKAAHSPDGVPGSDRYTNIWEADNRELLRTQNQLKTLGGQKPPKLWEPSGPGTPGE